MSAEFPRVPRVWANAVFSPGRFGILHRGLPWAEVMKAYYWDNVRVAMMLAEENGLGVNANYLAVYRMIEAEHVTREASVMSDRGDWLLLEYQQPDDADPIASLNAVESLVRRGCDQVAEMFGWHHGPAVLFTMLHPATNAPYVPGRHGFFIDKYPFDKVCLPSNLLQRPAELLSAVRHEYAHAMVLNRTQGLCPTWLHEAVALVAEHEGRPPARQAWRWLGPSELNRAFQEDRESDEGSPVVSGAYRQCQTIGAYLCALKGPQALGDLLDAFTDNSFARELAMRVLNQRPEDEALKQVFGLRARELFRRSKEWA